MSAVNRFVAARLGSARWMLGTLAAWLLATLAWRPLLLPDEGRYAGVAWEMLLGDPLTPTLDGLPFFHKPPLAYWIGIAAMHVVGPQAWAVRLAPALGAFAMGAALWWWLRRWHGENVAALGLAALATSPFFFIGGQYVNHDMLVAGCITVTIVAWLAGLEPDAAVRECRLAFAMGWAAAALGFLAKGLIGIVLPLLVVVPWLLWQRRFGALRRLADPWGLLIALVIALPWPLAMERAHPGFVDYFIVGQHFRRYGSGGFNNVAPFWFYAAVLPLLTLPWSLWAPEMLRRLVPRDPKRVLWAWWAASVLLFFSLPASKLVGYALPALPAWIALLALAAQRGTRWRLALPAAAATCVAAVGALAWVAPNSQRDVSTALRTLRQPLDRVVFVDAYPYDIVFDAQLQTPPIVASRWERDEILHRDNWQRELLDAAGFAPEAGRTRLWPLQALDRLPCEAHDTWFVTPLAGAPLLAAVPDVQRVMTGRHAELWRAPGRACG